MTGINIITKLIVIITVITISFISPCYPTISDRRLCYDPKCSVPISLAKTLSNYHANMPDIMSFKSNVDVKVFSKEAGKRKDLWGVEINGMRGYVPFKFLKETKVMYKTLKHEVPTEVIVETIQKNDSNKVSESLNNVPNPTENQSVESAKIDQNLEKVNANGIAKDASSESVPVIDQVSPSYEIHDGTTIHLVRNDEPSEPSYATRVPRSTADIGEQPILSIHPNIASTVTRKLPEDALPDVDVPDDAAKYLEATGQKDNTSGGKISGEGIAATTTELPTNTATIDETPNEKTETNFNDSPEVLEDNLELKDIEGVKPPVEATKETETPTSQENVTKSTVSSDDKNNEDDEEDDDSEGNDDGDDDATVESGEAAENNDTVMEQEKNETFSSSVKNENFSSSVKNETSSTGIQSVAEKDETTKTVTEKPVVEEEINPAVDTKPEVVVTESSDNSKGNETVDSKYSVEDNNFDTNVTTDFTVDDNAGAAAEANITDEASVEKVDDNSSTNTEIKDEPKVDSSNAEQEASPEAQGFAGVVEEIKTEQEHKAKAEEAPPSIMNPLFNRLSKIPALMKEVVGNAISAGAADSPTATEENAAPEATESAEDISNKQNSSSPVDFSTDINNNNDYQNDTDNSNSAEPAQTQTETSGEKLESENHDKFVNISSDSIDNEKSTNDSTADSVEPQTGEELIKDTPVQPGISKEDELTGFRQDTLATDDTSSFNGFPANRNLLNVGSTFQPEDIEDSIDEEATTVATPLMDDLVPSDNEKNPEINEKESSIEAPAESSTSESATESIATESTESIGKSLEIDEFTKSEENHNFLHEEKEELGASIQFGGKFWETFSYVVLTAFTTLLFSLGYYYIENTRRDSQLIAKINKLEKELLVASKECTVLDDTLKSTKSKLDSIEDESFGSNEMVVSLKAELEASQIAKSELEDQVAMLEKELESATEAGLELERMLREILSTNNEENPLAQSVEDLQQRLNAQQAANEALTNTLNLKAQENENLTSDLAMMTQKCEQLEVEVTRVTEELKQQNNAKNNMEQTMLDKVEELEKQVKDISVERINLRKQLKGKEMELKDLLEVVNQMNINNLDFEKLYNVSKVKAEASQLLEERDDLKIRLSEVEGAHQLLEEHVKLINEEVSSLSEQCKLAEKAKRDAETRVEVLSNFFKEKEAQRQKEEAVWLQKQGEVSSTVERLHTMQNEIHNYKQQIEMLKREILDQEREYKNQISSLETKAHEQWVMARQHERRLEESKAEAGQLRNRLTMIEKNLNDIDPEAKLHRLEANGETTTSPQLFIGAEASSSPIMFTGSSGVPLPPPPSYLYGPPVPPFMPPPPPHSSSGILPYDVGQRPPPLGGRLSSPPPLHGSGSSRYDNPRSPPPPLSPSMLPPYGPHPHRAYPPPFVNDRIHPPPPPPHSSMLPPPLNPSSHNWGDDSLPPLRNSGFQPHQQHHRDQQRARNHKGSLHSSGESLDKNV